jgi:hypothetical protein
MVIFWIRCRNLEKPMLSKKQIIVGSAILVATAAGVGFYIWQKKFKAVSKKEYVVIEDSVVEIEEPKVNLIQDAPWRVKPPIDEVYTELTGKDPIVDEQFEVTEETEIDTEDLYKYISPIMSNEYFSTMFRDYSRCACTYYIFDDLLMDNDNVRQINPDLVFGDFDKSTLEAIPPTKVYFKNDLNNTLYEVYPSIEIPRDGEDSPEEPEYDGDDEVEYN